MTLKRRQFTKEFKLQVIREVEAGKSLAQAAREHQLHPNTIIRWRKLQQQYAERAIIMLIYFKCCAPRASDRELARRLIGD